MRIFDDDVVGEDLFIHLFIFHISDPKPSGQSSDRFDLQIYACQMDPPPINGESKSQFGFFFFYYHYYLNPTVNSRIYIAHDWTVSFELFDRGFGGETRSSY